MCIFPLFFNSMGEICREQQGIAELEILCPNSTYLYGFILAQTGLAAIEDQKHPRQQAEVDLASLAAVLRHSNLACAISSGFPMCGSKILLFILSSVFLPSLFCYQEHLFNHVRLHERMQQISVSVRLLAYRKS